MVFSSHSAEQGSAERSYSEQLRSPSRRVFLRHARALLSEIEKVDTSAAMLGMSETARVKLRTAAFMSVCIESQTGSARPLDIVVIAGSAGVGKSSLFNALAGEDLSPVSAVRPCTQQGVALVHPSDEAAFRAHPASRWVRIVCHASAVRGVVLIDSPASDWAQPDLYEKSQCLLDMASRVIFVTTMYRYGDGAAWDTLSRLHSRGVECAGVMNRVSAQADGTAEQDFRRLWRNAGLSSARIAVMYEGELMGKNETALPRVAAHSAEGDGDADACSVRKRRRTRHARSHSCTDTSSCARTSQNARTSRHLDVQRDCTDGVRTRRVHAHSQLAFEETVPRFTPHRSGMAEVQRWIDMAARGRYLRARTQRPHDPYADLRKDVNFLADSVDIARHALIDLCDRAREGAAPPFEKLMTNVKMGRFGQGAAQSVWQAMMAGRGALADVKLHGELGRRSGDHSACDAELGAVMETIMASLRLALLQGLDTAMLNTEHMWAKGALSADKYIEQARARIDKEDIVHSALNKWLTDMADIAREMGVNHTSMGLWCSEAGLANLIGAAASGVNGAADMAREAGLEEGVWGARAALERRIRGALEELISCYAQPIRSMPLPDSSALRARLDEFLRIAYAQSGSSALRRGAQVALGVTPAGNNGTGGSGGKEGQL